MPLTPPTGWDAGELNKYFTDLNTRSQVEATKYVDERVPAYLTPYLVEWRADNPPPQPPGPTQALVTDGDITALQDTFTNVLGTVTLHCAGGVMTFVAQHLQPQLAMINNGGAVIVHNAAGVAVAGSPGVAEVAGSNLVDVKLTV